MRGRDGCRAASVARGGGGGERMAGRYWYRVGWWEEWEVRGSGGGQTIYYPFFITNTHHISHYSDTSQ